MNATEFTYWLQGFFEISGSNELSPEQVQIVKDHLALCFEKVTPHHNSYQGLSWDENGALNFNHGPHPSC